MKAKHLLAVAWVTSVFGVVAGLVAWGQAYDWQFFMSNYILFPLLGLVAFSLMWSHYITAALRLYAGLDRNVTAKYFEITSVVVLAAILLHPGLLAYQLWADGSGLPPGSTLNYLPESKDIYILMGITSLCLFLAFELRRWFEGRGWWKYVQYLTDIAMIMIYIHAIQIGGQLQEGWFRGVWYFYGLSLLISLGYIYYKKLKPSAK